MRLFAAFDPSPDVVRSMSRALPADDASVRWTRPSQWHVTVAFYGDVPDGSVAELAERLTRAAGRCPPMLLALSGVGGFPSRRKARVVAATLAGDVESLGRLAQRCAAAGSRCGINMEHRRFRPHLTLGRARSEPVDVDRLLPGGVPELSWRVTQLGLVSSRLGPVVSHETIASLPLTG